MSIQSTVGVDLAKDVIQVCEYRNSKVIMNQAMNHSKFAEWLTLKSPCLIIFETCSTSNYWKQFSTNCGHDARLIASRLVEAVRQNQKTDKNDALAIIQAASLPEVSFVDGKTVVQQQLQSILRLRELAVKQKTALSNQLKALLLEFNVRVRGAQAMKSTIQNILEDAENGLSATFRKALHLAWGNYEQTALSVIAFDECLNRIVTDIPECKKFRQLEGIGVINAVNLYLAFYCEEGESPRTSKNAAARLGLTPLQHSSGGKTQVGSIGRYVKNTTVRSQLITGAFTYVNQVEKREPRTAKDIWIKNMIARRGKKCTAVALANKTVRTAFSMVKNNTHYKAVPIAA